MRCFYHGDVEAVAVCKSCGRAICHDCYAEVGTGSACRNRCESDVTALNTIIERNKTVYRKTSGIYRRNGWLFLGIAIIFGAISAGSMNGEDRGVNYPLLALCVMFIAFAVIQFVNARRFTDK